MIDWVAENYPEHADENFFCVSIHRNQVINQCPDSSYGPKGKSASLRAAIEGLTLRLLLGEEVVEVEVQDVSAGIQIEFELPDSDERLQSDSPASSTTVTRLKLTPKTTENKRKCGYYTPDCLFVEDGCFLEEDLCICNHLSQLWSSLRNYRRRRIHNT